MAGIDEALEGFEEDFYVFEVEAGGGFVEDEEGRFFRLRIGVGFRIGRFVELSF